MSITRRIKLLTIINNNTVLARLADHDYGVVVNTFRYEPSIPFSVSALQSVTGFSPNNCELSFPNNQIGILSSNFILSGGLDKFEFQLSYFEIDTAAVYPVDSFFVESFSVNQKEVKLNLLSIESRLDSVSLNMLYSLNCGYAFGGKFCKVDANSFSVSYIPVNFQINDPFQLAVNSVPPQSQFANNGTLELSLSARYFNVSIFKSYRTFIEKGVDKIIDLYTPLYIPKADITSLKVIPGCNKTISDCAFYNNEARFGGFPKIAGKSVNLSVPTRQ